MANRLPHCGAIITLLAICKLNHRESYADIAAVTMLFPLPALVLVLVVRTHLLILCVKCRICRTSKVVANIVIQP